MARIDALSIRMLFVCGLTLQGCTDAKPELTGGTKGLNSFKLQNGSSSIIIPVSTATDTVYVSGQCDKRQTDILLMTDLNPTWVSAATIANAGSDLDCSDGTFSIQIAANNVAVLSSGVSGNMRMRGKRGSFTTDDSLVTLTMTSAATLLGYVRNDGSIMNGNLTTPVDFSSTLFNPRNFSFFKTDLEQVLGTGQGVAREGGTTVLDGESVTMSALDPKVISLSKRPSPSTAGAFEYWALLSHGQVVKVNTDGTLDFVTACPFQPNCMGYERFQSISVGQTDHLYVLDHEGRLFDARNLTTAVQTLSPLVRQVAYY